MVLLDINFPKLTPTSGVELVCPCATCVLYGGLDVQNTARAQHWDPISGAFLLWFHWPFRKIAPKLVSKTCFAARQDFETMAQTFMLNFRMPHCAFFYYMLHDFFVTFYDFFFLFWFNFICSTTLIRFRLTRKVQSFCVWATYSPRQCAKRSEIALMPTDLDHSMWLWSSELPLALSISPWSAKMKMVHLALMTWEMTPRNKCASSAPHCRNP